MKALTTAIYSKLAGSALNTSIGGRLYKSEAPQSTAFPHVTYFVVSDLPEYPGGHTIEQVLLQFDVWSSASSSTESEDILTNLRALYDDCTLVIAGNTLIYFIRGNLTESREEITTPAGTVGVWHFAQEYTLEYTN